MGTFLKARQGTIFRYRFSVYSPSITDNNKPDMDNPYNLTGCTARFTLATPTPVTYNTPPQVTIEPNPGVIIVVIPATITKDWNQGNLQYELEIIPETGEENAYALVYGTIVVERQIA